MDCVQKNTGLFGKLGKVEGVCFQMIIIVFLEFRYHHGLSWTEDVRERREKNHLGYSLTPREI